MARTGTAQRDDSDSTGHLLHSSCRCRFVKIKHFKGNAISISFKTHIICGADYLEFASQLCLSSLYQSFPDLPLFPGKHFRRVPIGRIGALRGARDEGIDRKTSAHQAKTPNIRQRSCADDWMWLTEADHGEAVQCPGSPYWGMKVFVFLLLPDDHPFWSAQDYQ